MDTHSNGSRSSNHKEQGSSRAREEAEADQENETASVHADQTRDKGALYGL